MKFFKICVIFALVGFALTAFASGPAVKNVKKAKTIAELVKMYDSTSCKDCHAEIYEEWEQSLHARSMFGPADVGRTAATFKTTVENGHKDWPFSGVKKPEDMKIEHLMVCANCHLPQLADAEDSVAQEIMKNVYAFKETDDAAAKTLQSLNINCLVCHQRNAIVHKWADGYPEKNVVYGSKNGEHPTPDFPKMKQSKIMGESILCGQCHGQGPNFGQDNPTQCATLYGSYNFAYIPEGERETCQDCHMKKSKLGHNMQSYRSPELAKMAVDMHVYAEGYQWRDIATTTPAATVIVELKNKAGHAIPDG